MTKWTFFILLLIGCIVNGQEHARVYFSEKEGVEDFLMAPDSILTPRAIERKNRFNSPIDARDVPIDQSRIDAIKMSAGIELKAKSKWLNCVHVIGSIEAIQNLESLPFVEKVVFANGSLNAKQDRSPKSTRDYLRHKKTSLNADFLYGASRDQIYLFGLQVLHNADFTGKGLLIAVMDAGFPEVSTIEVFKRLRENEGLLGGYDFEHKTDSIFKYKGSDHGTKVLSDMAGFMDGTFVGTAPDAKYILYKTEVAESETPVEESYWVEAAERADSLGVDLINTSLGYSLFDDPDYDYSPEDMDGATAFISQGANIATEKGILVVNSAGNEGDVPWGIITAPADANVFTVGAVNAEGSYAPFSSRGPNAQGVVKPDGMAQGLGSAVVTPDNRVVANNGTSFASPIMAGAIACLWQAYPDRTNLEIMQMVRESSSLYDHPNEKMGYGIPDFTQLLPKDIVDASKNNIVVFPNPATEHLTVRVPKGQSILQKSIYDASGNLILQETGESVQAEIPTDRLSSGLYVAVIVLNNERVVRYKFLKR